MTSPLDVRKVLKVAHISSIGRFLDEDNIEDYDYKLRSRKDIMGNEYNIVLISPKQNLEKGLYAAKVVIDSKTGLIVELEYEIPDSHKPYAKEFNLLVLKGKLLSNKFRIMFNITENAYNIFYVLVDFEMRVWNKKSIDSKFKFVSDLIVTNLQKDNIQFDKKTAYNKKSLYKRDVQTKEKFWLNYNSIQLTDEEQKIIETLNKNSASNDG